MTEAASLAKAALLAGKLVQEIAKRHDHIPEEYLHKDGFPEAIDAPNVWNNDLLIDWSLLSSSSTPELTKLQSALSQWGCFQIVNHGIESSFLEDLIEVTKQFFALPLEEKFKCSAEGSMSIGYGSDVLYAGTQTLNWNDRLIFKLKSKQEGNLQCWPQKPENFRKMIDEYSTKITEVNKVICKAIERSLNLEENCIDLGKQGPTLARFNLYPRCPCPERILGTKGHSDATMITYLLPDNEVEGLHILKDDQWYKVSIIPGALFINFGDIGEVMTNGVFKSAVHRVGTNSEQDRISVAMFFIPDDDRIIEPLSELVSAHQPQLYKKFTYPEFMKKFFECFKHGTRALDAFRV